MSHIVSIQTKIRDPVAIRPACGRLQLAEPVFGEVKLFASPATGWAVQLPDWRYPVVCDVNTATLGYDNLNGRWGDRPRAAACSTVRPKFDPKMRQVWCEAN